MSCRLSKLHCRWFGAASLLAACGFAASAPSVLADPAAAHSPAQEQVSRDFQKTLSLGSGQSFSIENKFGEVRVHGESGRDVKINATIRVQASSREEADAYAQTASAASRPTVFVAVPTSTTATARSPPTKPDHPSSTIPSAASSCATPTATPW